MLHSFEGDKNKELDFVIVHNEITYFYFLQYREMILCYRRQLEHYLNWVEWGPTFVGSNPFISHQSIGRGSGSNFTPIMHHWIGYIEEV